MYEFFTQHSIYVVLTIVLTIWIGIAFYLLRLERAVTRLQHDIPLSTNEASQK